MIGQTVGMLENRAARMFPDETAVVYGEQRMTYRQLHERINKCAQAFIRLGIQKGDRVGLFLPNCTEYLEIDFALAKLGAVKVPPDEATGNGDGRRG